MKYNFDEVIDRSNNRSSKYDERLKKFGTEDVIPLWVADMDFKTAQPIIDACKKKAEEGIWGYTSRPASYFEAVQEWEEKYYGWKPVLCRKSGHKFIHTKAEHHKTRRIVLAAPL